MDSVRGVRIHCACGAILKCTQLSTSKVRNVVLLCCLCGVFTAPTKLQWILTCRHRTGHGALSFTMDSELRFRIAAVYATTLSRHNHREPSGREYDHVILGKHPFRTLRTTEVILGRQLLGYLGFMLPPADFMRFFGSATHPWPPDEWSHSPWLFFGLVQNRPKDVSREDPNQLWMQKTDLVKHAGVLVKTLTLLRVGWPSCRRNTPFCRPQAATASHRDGRMIMLSLGNTLLEALGFVWKPLGPSCLRFSGFVECLRRFASFCSGTTNVSRILSFAEVTCSAFFSSEFVAHLRCNCRSSTVALPLNGFLGVVCLSCDWGINDSVFLLHFPPVN